MEKIIADDFSDVTESMDITEDYIEFMKKNGTKAVCSTVSLGGNSAQCYLYNGKALLRETITEDGFGHISTSTRYALVSDDDWESLYDATPFDAENDAKTTDLALKWVSRNGHRFDWVDENGDDFEEDDED